MGQKSLTLRKKTNAELIAEFKDLAKGVKKESDRYTRKNRENKSRM